MIKALPLESTILHFHIPNTAVLFIVLIMTNVALVSAPTYILNVNYCSVVDNLFNKKSLE